ncbi:MAG: prepilin peptidase [Planctomycetia bacterium]
MSVATVPWPTVDLLIDATVAAGICLLAANVGSFLNVVAHRVPRGMSVARGGSRCPACGNAIRWRDNVPVMGWLVLGGRCRDCGAAIAARYPLVEAAAAGIGGIAAVELLSGGRTWPAGRFGTGRSGIDVLLMAGDWQLALVCAAHAAVLLVLLLWTLFEADRTRVTNTGFLAVAAGLAMVAVAAGGPTVAAGWPAAGQAAVGAAAGAALGVTAGNPWLRQAFVLVGTVLGWRAVVGAGAIMAAMAVGRFAVECWRGRRLSLEPTCGDLLMATAVQVLAWRWIAAVWAGDG